MKNEIRWGILGPGKIAHKFAQDLTQIPNATLWAVASRSVERAKIFASTYEIPHVYDDYTKLLNCPDLDVVYIATPHDSHAHWTSQLIDANIAVLCEKPWTTDTLQAANIRNLAQEKKVFVMEALWTRFLPSTQKILSLIESNAIGEIIGLKADFGFQADFDPNSRLFKSTLAGGALLDIGIYPVFLSHLLFGKPSEIQAMAKLASTGVDIDTGILLKHSEAQIAHLHCTVEADTKTEAFIYGTTGTIHWHSRWHEPPGSFSIIRAEQAPENHFFDRPNNGYLYEAVHVQECLQKRLSESPLLPLSFSVELSKTLHEIRKMIGVVYPWEE